MARPVHAPHVSTEPPRRTGDRALRTLVVVLGLVLLLPLLMMALAMPMMGMVGWYGGTMGDYGGMVGYSPLWGLGMMLLWVLVLGGVGYVVYRVLAGDGGVTETGDPAIEELRVAYARGELTDEEFEERRERLRQEE